MPESAHDREQVIKALEEVLGWDEMTRSQQLGKFLSYIVTRTLDGDGQGIKAYAIAVDVFGRSADFDPQADPIVRVQARRLRALLDSYYDGPGRGSAVRLFLPVGRYMPEFRDGQQALAVTAETDEQPISAVRLAKVGPTWLALAFVVGAIATLAVVMSNMAPGLLSAGHSEPGLQQPSVTIFEFQNLTGDANRLPLVAGLSVELVTDLQQFEDLTVEYAGAGVVAAPPAVTPEVAPPTDFNLTGLARISEGRVQYSAILTNAKSNAVVWSKSIAIEHSVGSDAEALDAISRDFSLILGNTRGPLHAAGHEWAAAVNGPDYLKSPYACMMLFHRFRDSGASADGALASDCFAGLSDAERQAGRAQAAIATLLIDAPQPRDGDGQARSAEAARSLQVAMTAAPTSGFVWEQRAHFALSQGDLENARTAFSSSVQLNPANSDTLAGFARLLALGGNLDDAIKMSNAAVYASPDPPGWYYCVPTLVALRATDFRLAMENAAIYADADRELGPVLAVVAAAGANSSDGVNRYLPQVLDAVSFRAQGILPSLRRWVGDRDLLDSVASALRQAGVPDAALSGSF